MGGRRGTRRGRCSRRLLSRASLLSLPDWKLVVVVVVGRRRREVGRLCSASARCFAGGSLEGTRSIIGEGGVTWAQVRIGLDGLDRQMLASRRDCYEITNSSGALLDTGRRPAPRPLCHWLHLDWPGLGWALGRAVKSGGCFCCIGRIRGCAPPDGPQGA